MSRKNTKQRERGIMATDGIIAILLIILFSGIIISMITSIIIESTKLKITSMQVSIITKTFEHIEEVPYEQVTENEIIEYINNIEPDKISAGTKSSTLTTLYRVWVTVEYYAPEGEEDHFDIIKIITLNVENTLNNKTYSTEMSRIKKASTQELNNIFTQ